MKNDYKEINFTCKKDLVHFKKILLAKRQHMMNQLEILSENIDQSSISKIEKKITAEDNSKGESVSVNNDEINTILYEQALIFIEKLDEAIARIEQGTHCFCYTDNDERHTEYKNQFKLDL